MTPPRRTAFGALALVPLLLLGACSSPESVDDGGWSSPAKGLVEDSASPIVESAQDEITEGTSPTVEVLTPEEMWAENLQRERGTTVRGLASVLGIRRSLVRENVESVVEACTQTAEEVGLQRRARAFGATMTGDAGAVTRERAIAGITLVLTTVCPEVLDKHGEQVELRETRLREAEKQRKREARERRRQARERARVEREEREAEVRAEELRQERSQRSSAYYANCTEAREAGAAPVRRGQPGYGDHLDRDGDGIGCE